jgi:glycosyltransferase involved in cell wall biosynthesis
LKNKFLIWTRWIDDFYNNSMPPDSIGGAEIQLSFWAKLLSDNGNKVFTFSWRLNFIFKKYNGVYFLWIPWIRKIGVVFWYFRFLYLIIIKPDFLIVRSNRDLIIVCYLKKYFKFKIIYMIASDQYIFSKDSSSAYPINLVRKGIDYYIVQNRHQETYLLNIVPSKYILFIPNIFNINFVKNTPVETTKKFDFIWIANTRSVKRIDYFFDIAKKLKKYKFAFIGKILENDQKQFILDELEINSNIEVFGPKTYIDVCLIISQSKVLLNTSLYEGFPNTFIQAWYFNLPIISTVNPNEVITTFNLGFYETNKSNFISKCQNIIENKKVYDEISCNAKKYFTSNYRMNSAYSLFRDFVYSDFNENKK